MFPGNHVAEQPDRAAVIVADTGAALSFRELDDESLRFASHLYRAGLRRGDHIAMITDNAVTAFVVYWAALRSGLYITAVNSHLTADEAAYIVNDCGARILVASAALGELARQVGERTPQVESHLAFGGALDGYDSFEAALAAVTEPGLPAQPRGADMLYSSGTTGRPKGIRVPLPTHAVDEPGDLATALFGQLYGFDRDTVYLSPAPIYHAAPLRFGGVVQALGGTVVLLSRFDAEAALAAIERYRVTHSQWVPTMFIRMLKLDSGVRGKYDLSSHRVAVHAAAPCPVEVKQAMIDWWGPIIHEYYSCTESNGLTFIDSAQWQRRPGSVGRPALGVLHICADDGQPLPPREIGTVYFERDTAAFEYHNAPDKTAATRHPAHPDWTTTGDIGYVDEDGYLYLTDRQAFMIISGGVNIYPQEIENALALHPKVLDVAVIGIPDAEMGQSVKAFVQPAPDAADTDLATELTAFLRERIAGYKIPRTFTLVDSLPRTPTGKLAKGLLPRPADPADLPPG
ncbi:acyl-CoA synthetase [Nocardia heshunensis]